MSQSSPSYSPSFPLHLTCHHNRHHTRRLLLAIILSVSYSLSSSPPACSSPSSSSSCSSRHVVFANFPLFPTRRTMLLTSKQHYYLIAAMGMMLGACAGNAKCDSSIYRCTLDIENRTGLSHYAWNPLRVCECEASICCDILRLDSQHDRGAMTRVAPTRPVGKYPDTAASRRKMPFHTQSSRQMPWRAQCSA